MFFDFLFGDEALFFGLDLGVEVFGVTFLWALFNEFALNGVLQEGFFHVLWEAGIELFQFAPRLLVAVDLWQQFLNFSHNALLLSEGWKRK